MAVGDGDITSGHIRVRYGIAHPADQTAAVTTIETKVLPRIIIVRNRAAVNGAAHHKSGQNCRISLILGILRIHHHQVLDSTVGITEKGLVNLVHLQLQVLDLVVTSVINSPERVFDCGIFSNRSPFGIAHVNVRSLLPVDGIHHTMQPRNRKALVGEVRAAVDAVSEVFQVGQTVDGERVGLRPDKGSLVRHNVVIAGMSGVVISQRGGKPHRALLHWGNSIVRNRHHRRPKIVFSPADIGHRRQCKRRGHAQQVVNIVVGICKFKRQAGELNCRLAESEHVQIGVIVSLTGYKSRA